MKIENIQAVTPLFLGFIGMVLGSAVVFSPSISDVRCAGILGLASAAIAGASGLAQNRDSDSANIRGDQISIQSVQGEEPEK